LQTAFKEEGQKMKGEAQSSWKLMKTTKAQRTQSKGQWQKPDKLGKSERSNEALAVECRFRLRSTHGFPTALNLRFLKCAQPTVYRVRSTRDLSSAERSRSTAFCKIDNCQVNEQQLDMPIKQKSIRIWTRNRFHVQPCL
jgi:hypothetical protein